MEHNVFHTEKDKSTQKNCPFSSGDYSAVSTNERFLRGMRMNTISPAANLYDITHPDSPHNNESFQPWFAPDAELPRALAIRKAIYTENSERTCMTDHDRPAVRSAAQQLLELQTSYLTRTFPDIYQIAGDDIVIASTGDKYPLHPAGSDLHPLAISGLIGQEDICIVERTGDNRYQMVAGFLASPTNWNLSQFMYMDMDGIHEDVAGYTERLKKVVDTSLESLPEFPEGIKARNNMFFRLDSSLGIIPDVNPEVNADSVTNPGEDIFLRSERETLTRLPATEKYPENDRFIIFTIKPHVFPLSEVMRMRGDRLLKVIQTNEKLRAYEFSPLAEQYIYSQVQKYID